MRTPGQRRHDALLTGWKLLFASGRLPNAGGVATMLVLSMDADDFGTDTGVATTGHGYPVPVAVAKRWLDPEARVLLTLLSKTRGILAYCDKQRLFTEQQRWAMFARDRRLHLPRLRRPARLARCPPRHRLATHPPHQRRRRRPGLRTPPRHLPENGLALHHAQRPTPLDPTRLGRPRPTTRPQPRPRPRPRPGLDRSAPLPLSQRRRRRPAVWCARLCAGRRRWCPAPGSAAGPDERAPARGHTAHG